MARVAFVTLLPVFAAFVAIRLVVTPFTELANLVKSAYTAATSKDSDTAKPSVYGFQPIVLKSVDIAFNVWTLGLWTLVPAIKKLVTLDGQIESLKAQIAAVDAKGNKLIKALNEGRAKLEKNLADAQGALPPPLNNLAINKAQKALDAYLVYTKSVTDLLLEKCKEMNVKLEAKENALKAKNQAKAEKTSAKSSKKFEGPSSDESHPQAEAGLSDNVVPLMHSKKSCVGKNKASQDVTEPVANADANTQSEPGKGAENDIGLLKEPDGKFSLK